MNSFDVTFNILGVSQFQINSSIKLNLTNAEGCYTINYPQLNISVKICQIEIIYFLYNTDGSINSLNRGSSSYSQNLSKHI